MSQRTERLLRITARLDRIAQVRKFVTEAAAAAGLDERAVYHCEMAVDETVTNIIEHGYDGGADEAMIDVQCGIENGHFVITIVDSGPPFNPLALDDPDPATPLDERKAGGWGVFFVKKMMDEVTYAYRYGRNQLILAKRLPPAAGEPSHAVREDVPRREAAPGVRVVAPSGRLDSLASPQFEATLRAELEAGYPVLVVDMSQVSYISSSGLKALIGARRSAQKQNGEIVLSGLRPRVREVFQMVGFDQVFRIFAAVEQALDAVELQEGRNA